MTLTLLALMIAPFGLKTVLDPNGMHRHIQNASRDPSLPLAFAAFNFLLAAFILSETGFDFRFVAESQAILTWIALLIAIKGMLILIPGYLPKIASIVKESMVPYMGTLALLVCLGLIYLDTRVLL